VQPGHKRSNQPSSRSLTKSNRPGRRFARKLPVNDGGTLNKPVQGRVIDDDIIYSRQCQISERALAIVVSITSMASFCATTGKRDRQFGHGRRQDENEPTSTTHLSCNACGAHASESRNSMSAAISHSPLRCFTRCAIGRLPCNFAHSAKL